MNGRKCNGEQVKAVSEEPAEVRRLLGRIVSPFVFVILPSRLVPPTLLPHARASSSVSAARDSADRPVPIRAGVHADRRGRRASRDSIHGRLYNSFQGEAGCKYTYLHFHRVD